MNLTSRAGGLRSEAILGLELALPGEEVMKGTSQRCEYCIPHDSKGFCLGHVRAHGASTV